MVYFNLYTESRRNLVKGVKRKRMWPGQSTPAGTVSKTLLCPKKAPATQSTLVGLGQQRVRVPCRHCLGNNIELHERTSKTEAGLGDLTAGRREGLFN